MAKPKETAEAPPHVSNEEATVSLFREDPELAAEYLNQVLADGNREELLLAIRYVSAAFGGIAGIARATKLNARTLYRTLSERGNPELTTLISLLAAMGLRLAVTPIKRTSHKRTRRA